MTAIAGLRTAQALSAYKSMDSAPGDASGGGAFGDLLSKSLGSAINTSQQAETQATTAIEGGGDLTHVVTAVSRAELALQTTVAVRDRVLQAYQDIIKMSI